MENKIFDVIYQFSLKKHSVKAFNNDFEKLSVRMYVSTRVCI